MMEYPNIRVTSVLIDGIRDNKQEYKIVFKNKKVRCIPKLKVPIRVKKWDSIIETDLLEAYLNCIPYSYAYGDFRFIPSREFGYQKFIQEFSKFYKLRWNENDFVRVYCFINQSGWRKIANKYFSSLLNEWVFGDSVASIDHKNETEYGSIVRKCKLTGKYEIRRDSNGSVILMSSDRIILLSKKRKEEKMATEIDIIPTEKNSFEDEYKNILLESFRVMLPKHMSYGKSDLGNKEGLIKVLHKIEMNSARVKKFLEGEIEDKTDCKITGMVKRPGDKYSKEEIGCEVQITPKNGNTKTVDLIRMFFEGMDDAYIDLINYAAISLMIRRGHWEKEISQELKDKINKGVF